MKLTKIHLIIILALALILCPILGVCSNIREGYDNGLGVGGGGDVEGVDLTEEMDEDDVIQEGYHGEDEDEDDDQEGYGNTTRIQ
jgi:hypothetical protein